MVKDRSCINCTMCCEGWLSGEAHGNKFYPGKFCIYLKNEQCSIYDSRPKMCKDFNCEWRLDPTIPEEFKPNLVNFMIIKSRFKNMNYTALIGNNFSPDQRVLNYFIKKQLNGDIDNLVYTIEGSPCIRGSAEFEKLFSKLNVLTLSPTCKKDYPIVDP